MTETQISREPASTASLADDGREGGPANDDGITRIDFDEALSIAILLLKEGAIDDAATVFGKIMALAPDHPVALEYFGVLMQMKGDGGVAENAIRRSIALGGDRAGAYNNLGIVLKRQGRVDDAATAYARALELDPADADAHNNLGVLLKAQGDKPGAEARYRRAIDLRPTHAGAWQNLGILLAAQRRFEEAVTCYCKAVTLQPAGEARKLLALAHCNLGQPERAAEVLREWLREEPESAVAHHHLAACSGEAIPPRASDAYIEQTFDAFADSFDAKLEQLGYRAPQLVATILAQRRAAADRSLDVLDAGCGTGLCGPLVAPRAASLTGVDLSAKMLAAAKGRGVYDRLVQGELTAYLRGQSNAYDVIVSADTLVYFGELEEVLAAAVGALRPGGLLVFTLEESIDDSDHSLNFHGRYGHHQEYVRRALQQAGLAVEIVRAELRMEAGRPVVGLVVAAERPALATLSRERARG